MVFPTLTLSPEWQATDITDIPFNESELDNGYKARVNRTTVPIKVWEVRRKGLSKLEVDQLIQELSFYTGVDAFTWTPHPNIPSANYFCEEWVVTPLGLDVWEISAQFIKDNISECLAFAALIDTTEINDWLSGCLTWLATYTKDTLPLAANSNYLTVNAFHDVLGRGGYFPGSAGTTEGQAALGRACMEAFFTTNNVAWKNYAIALGEALVNYYYNDPIPSNNESSTLWVPHWLINVKESFVSRGPTANDPLNNGDFGRIVTFTNGVATIPSSADGDKLAVLYKVYSTDGVLLWNNVDAPLVSGTEYPIRYFVSDFQLKGQNFRIFPDTETSGGTIPIATNEIAGKIKLNTNYNGQAKLIYTTYTGPTIAVGQLFEPYPAWRELLPGETQAAFDVFPWSWALYDFLYQETNDDKWRRAAEATRYSAITTAVVNNLSYYYKKDSSDELFTYPGTQVVQVDNVNGYTGSRVTSGDKADWLRLDINAAPALQFDGDTPTGPFPSIEVQNFAITTGVESNVTIYAEAAHSNGGIVEVGLSTDSDAFNFDRIYKAYWQLNSSGDITTRIFQPEELIRWSGDYLTWFAAIAEDPIYTYGSATTFLEFQSITYNGVTFDALCARIDLNNSGDGAGLVFSGLGARISAPPKLYIKVLNHDTDLKIVDGDDDPWTYELDADPDFQLIQPSWDEMSSTVAQNPNETDALESIEFVYKDGPATIYLWFASPGDEPEQLDIPIFTYKAVLTSRDRNAHTLWVGDWRPIGNTLDQLQYNPGVVPFTVNVLNGIISDWRGIPYAGYQSPWMWFKWGYPNRQAQVEEFLLDAQAAYSTQVPGELFGPFAPVFSWAYWDNGDFLANGLNQFGWNGPDPNTAWAPYAYRALEASAHTWYLESTNINLQQIVMQFLSYLDDRYIANRDDDPITDFPPNEIGEVNYKEPHAAALIGRTALYANLAGGDPAITFRVLRNCIDFLRSQYISTGTMLGSFASGQPVYTVGSTNYKEYFVFWHAEIIEFLALLIRHKENITYPPCESVFQESIPSYLDNWKFSGYLDGGTLPQSYTWVLYADDVTKWGSDAIAANSSFDQSQKLQNIIDAIAVDSTYDNRDYDNQVQLILPAGTIVIAKQIYLYLNFFILSGSGQDSTTISFEPDLDTRYDVDLSGSGSNDGDDFELGLMSYGESNGGWIFPGRACFRVQPIQIHPRYTDEFNAAPSNRKDFYYGSINFPWRTGLLVDQSIPYPAREGDTKLKLNESPLGIYAGSYILLYSANTKTWYNSIGVTNNGNHRSVPIARTRIHRVISVDVDNFELTLQRPLEFDVPANQEADGDVALSSDSSYESRVVPLSPVLGAGIENLKITQPMTGVPAVGGGSYTLTTPTAEHNYNNMAAEYALHGIVLKWAVNCFTRNVSTYYTGSHAIATEFSKNLVVESCDFEGSWNKGKGGNGYVRFSKCWDSIIRDNKLRHLRHITLQWSASFNIIRNNDIDCDLNFHGGWERFNLLENNIVNVPFEHRFGDVNSSNPAQGSIWYPLWWGAGLHAGNWSTSTGPQNFVFNNQLFIQKTEGGNYDIYSPYDNENTIYVFGWDYNTTRGSEYEHLKLNGSNISAWTKNEEIDFSTTPNSGVNDLSSYTGGSLYDVASNLDISFATLPNAFGNIAITYSSFTGYSSHLSDLELNGSSVERFLDISGNGAHGVPVDDDPVLGSDLNSFNTVEFSNSRLDASLTIGNTCTWFLVFKTNAASTSSERILEIRYSDKSIQLYPSGGGQRLLLAFFNGFSFDQGITHPETEFREGEWQILSFSIDYNSGEATSWLHLFPVRESTGLTAPSGDSQTVFVGGRANGNNDYSGAIAEVICYTSILDQYSRYNIMEALAQKYSI